MGTTKRLAFVAVVLAACHKQPDDGSTRADEAAWDPPTAAFGFHSVNDVTCGHRAGRGQGSFSGTVEQVAMASTCAEAVAAGPSGIYFSDVNGAGGAIYRATRESGQKAWHTELVAARETNPGDIAVTASHAYWTVESNGSGAPGVRYVGADNIVHTLVETKERPARLVSNGTSVVWIDPSAGALMRATGSDVSIVHRGLFRPNLLAVDDKAAYAMVFDGVLLALPFHGNAYVVTSDARFVADLAVFGSHVYWLEGDKLRRAPRTGGLAEDVVAGLSEATQISFPEPRERGPIAWLTTSFGPVRVDPRRPDNDRATAQGGAVYGRMASIGDGMVAMTPDERTRILLFSRP